MAMTESISPAFRNQFAAEREKVIRRREVRGRYFDGGNGVRLYGKGRQERKEDGLIGQESNQVLESNNKGIPALNHCRLLITKVR